MVVNRRLKPGLAGSVVVNDAQGGPAGADEDAGGSFGVRYEKVIRVTAAGPERLSQFEWGL